MTFRSSILRSAPLLAGSFYCALNGAAAQTQEGGVSITAGGGIGAIPAYEGSKNFIATPLPLIDIGGLLDDRLFISTTRGIGFNAIDWGGLRAGVSVGFHQGRSSDDSPRLRGLSDISMAPTGGAFVSYTLKPVTFEVRGLRVFGPEPGTEIVAGATYSFSPTDRLKLSFGPQVTWADRRYDRSYFGVTSDQALQATAAGNPMQPYSPGSGLKQAGLNANALYRFNAHWGLVARLDLEELTSPAARNSPLTQRDFQPSAGLGLTYRF